MKKSLSRILIMAGGTGGHVFPGLAVADVLNEEKVDIHWLGTPYGLEARLVNDHGLPLHCINIKGLRGKGFFSWLKAPFNLSVALIQSLRLIHRLKPDVILGMGGFVTGPGGFAAWLLGYPVLVHEQNAKAGLTNKILAYFAKRVLEAFPHSFPPNCKVMTVGNPVRKKLESLPPPEQRFAKNQRLQLLVLGGSLGAKALNEIVPEALALLPIDKRPIVKHQTGEKHLSATKAIYEKLKVDAEIIPFIEEMAEAYCFADVVLCRAGALTVSELCSVGLGAIFVPFPHAVDDHQTANANFMTEKGAALCIQQSSLTKEKLAQEILRLIETPNECLAMAKKAYLLRQTKVASQIATLCKEVLN